MSRKSLMAELDSKTRKAIDRGQLRLVEEDGWYRAVRDIATQKSYVRGGTTVQFSAGEVVSVHFAPVKSGPEGVPASVTRRLAILDALGISDEEIIPVYVEAGAVSDAQKLEALNAWLGDIRSRRGNVYEEITKLRSEGAQEATARDAEGEGTTEVPSVDPEPASQVSAPTKPKAKAKTKAKK